MMSPDEIVRRACRFLAAGVVGVDDTQYLWGLANNYVAVSEDEQQLRMLIANARARMTELRQVKSNRWSDRDWKKLAGRVFERTLTRSVDGRNGTYTLEVRVDEHPDRWGHYVELTLIQPDHARFIYRSDFDKMSEGERKGVGFFGELVPSTSEMCRRSALPTNGSLAAFFGLKLERGA